MTFMFVEGTSKDICGCPKAFVACQHFCGYADNFWIDFCWGFSTNFLNQKYSLVILWLDQYSCDCELSKRTLWLAIKFETDFVIALKSSQISRFTQKMFVIDLDVLWLTNTVRNLSTQLRFEKF